MKYALAIFTTSAGALAALCFVVLLLASGANAKPVQITQIKLLMLSTAAVTLISIAVAAWAMFTGRPLTGAWVGAIPALFCITVFTILLKLEW